MKTRFQTSIFSSLAFAGKRAGVLICLLLAQGVFAQTYINSNNVSYFNPGTPPVPVIDATAFDNQSVFDCTYNVEINNNLEYCEPWWGTLYYTNSGEMMINAPVPTGVD